jgi:hypothetical protein
MLGVGFILVNDCHGYLVNHWKMQVGINSGEWFLSAFTFIVVK